MTQGNLASEFHETTLRNGNSAFAFELKYTRKFDGKVYSVKKRDYELRASYPNPVSLKSWLSHASEVIQLGERYCVVIFAQTVQCVLSAPGLPYAAFKLVEEVESTPQCCATIEVMLDYKTGRLESANREIETLKAQIASMDDLSTRSVDEKLEKEREEFKRKCEEFEPLVRDLARVEATLRESVGDVAGHLEVCADCKKSVYEFAAGMECLNRDANAKRRRVK
jgi:hypothetical protein